MEKKGETFTALGSKESVDVAENHLVIADQKKVLSWLWTHKVAEEVCVRPNDKIPAVPLFLCAQIRLQKGLEMLRGQFDGLYQGFYFVCIRFSLFVGL